MNTFVEVFTTGKTQLASARKAGFAVSFYVLVKRSSIAAIPAAIALNLWGYVAIPLTFSLYISIRAYIHAVSALPTITHHKRHCTKVLRLRRLVKDSVMQTSGKLLDLLTVTYT